MDKRRILYHARINSHLTLTQLGVRTAISPSVLRNIDEGKFELLPSGLYARSYIRTFASAVGLDPEATLADVEQLLPGAPDPLDALNAAKGDTATARLAKRCAELIAGPGPKALLKRVEQWPMAVSTRLDPWNEALLSQVERWPATVSHQLERGSQWVSSRAEPWQVFTRARPWQGSLRPQVTRCGAAAIDALVLLAIDTLLVLLISWSSGVPVKLLLQDAGWAMASFSAIPIGLYFLLFGGIGGSTLGRYVCSLMDPEPDHPLTLPDILRRAVLR